jgi:AraC-like DNA-binding protein
MMATPDFLTGTPVADTEALGMDALSDLIRVVRLTGGVFLDAWLSAPFSVVSQVEPQECRPYLDEARHIISFHYVVDGALHVCVEGEEPLHLRTGDIVLLPRNDPHVLGSAPYLPAEKVELEPTAEGGLPRLVHGGGGETAHVVCGFLGSDAPSSPLLATLPRLLCLNVAASGAGEWIASSFQFAAREIGAGRLGAASIVSRLSELLFVEALRSYVASLPPQQHGWLAALRDPFVSRALALLHAQPAKRWTAEDLAGQVGLSRSAFAERFTTLLGQPPMQYLAQWRMQLAAQRLRASREPLARVAQQIGYDSEAAFSRAFKRQFGEPPATWRLAQAPRRSLRPS